MRRHLTRRYKEARAAFRAGKIRPAFALSEAWRGGYGSKDFRADIMAGVVVGIVAMPLAMALAVAVGVPPQHGLYTAIVGGGVTALLGGSRWQVSGPTAAFVIILAPITAKFGLGGLMLATLMAGVILMTMGAAGLGRLIQYTPYPVTTGFTAGIAVVLATLQIKDFLGLQVEAMPDHYMERLGALAHSLPTARWAEAATGVFTLALLVLWPRITTRVPAPLVALSAAGAGTWLLHGLVPGFSVETIGDRFSYIVNGVVHSGIPRMPPLPALPWSFPGAGGQTLALSLDMVRSLLPAAFAIAMLGAIESLLSATVADGMARGKHDPDAELFAHGAGNISAAFFGGFASTGAIARTATNVRAGARSPVAAAVHALFVLAAMLALAPALAHLPMAALAALLLVVAWNMSEVKHFRHVLKAAPGSDVLVLLTCFSLTVLFDMVAAVTVGMLLASALFIRRMAELSDVRLTAKDHSSLRASVPEGAVLYRVTGALFFGAAHKAVSALERVDGGVRAVILDLSLVPAVDATGLVNLESALGRLRARGILVVLAGLQNQPAKAFRRADIRSKAGELVKCADVEEAVEAARRHLEDTAPPAS